MGNVQLWCLRAGSHIVQKIQPAITSNGHLAYEAIVVALASTGVRASGAGAPVPVVGRSSL